MIRDNQCPSVKLDEMGRARSALKSTTGLLCISTLLFMNFRMFLRFILQMIFDVEVFVEARMARENVC